MSFLNVSFITLVRREIHRYLKVLFQTIFTPLVNSILYLLIFGVSLGDNIKLQSGITYLAFIIPGLVMMACLNNAFQNSSSSIVSGKFSGDVEDWRVVPLTTQGIIWALCIGALSRGFLVGFLTLIVGELFYYWTYGDIIHIQSYFLFLVFLTVGAIVFSLVGIIVAIWAKTFDEMSAVGSLILTPLMFLGGVFFSIQSLSPFWQQVSLYNPLLYYINGFRFAMLGESDVSLQLCLIVSVLSLFISFFIAKYAIEKGSFQRW